MATALAFPTGSDTTQGTAYHYDMLNRLVGMDVLHNHAGGGQNFWKRGGLGKLKFDAQGQPDKTSMGRPWQTMYAYDPSGNLQQLYRNGPQKNSPDGFAMDRLEYFYQANSNRLDFVTDQNSLTPHYAADIDTGQTTGNYAYDASGNLLSDAQEGTFSVVWDRFNKVTWVHQHDGPDLQFAYDAAGQRALKQAGATTEHYARDGAGNLLALYRDTRLGDTAAVGPTAADTLNAQDAFLQAVLARLAMINPGGGGAHQLETELLAGCLLPQYRGIPHHVLAGYSTKDQFPGSLIGPLHSALDTLKKYFDMNCAARNLFALGAALPIDSSYAGLIKGTHYDQRELAEVPLYGSARLGVDKQRRFLLDSVNYRRSVWNPFAEAWQTLASLDPTGAEVSDWPVVDTQRVHVLGHRRYEFSNHLGNVLAVTSDRKILIDSAHTFLYYEADIYSLTDYYPFGMQMTGRTASLYLDTTSQNVTLQMDMAACSTCVKVDGYRFGFNTQEKTPELHENHYTAEYWEYDARVARRWNTDPKTITGISPYACFAGNPIVFSDVKGDTAAAFRPDGTFIGIEDDGKTNWTIRHYQRETLIREPETNEVGSIEYSDPRSINIISPESDIDLLKNGDIEKLIFVSRSEIEEMLIGSGVFDEKNRDNWFDYLATQGKGGGAMDYSYSAVKDRYPESVFGIKNKEKGTFYTNNVLFVPEVSDVLPLSLGAHNHMNFGNFLWGAGAHALTPLYTGDKFFLMGGAHYNSYFNHTTNLYPPQLDSRDDQLSIYLGTQFSKYSYLRSKSAVSDSDGKRTLSR